MRKAAKISIHGYLLKKGVRFLLLEILCMLTHLCANAQLPKLQWMNDIAGASGYATVNYVAADNQNNVYITGSFNGTIDFDPSAGVKNLTSAGQDDVFIGKYKQDGTLIWVEQIGGAGYDYGNCISVDKDGNITITGFFQSTVLDADPGSGVYDLNNPNGFGGEFTIHLDTNGNFLWANDFVLPAGPSAPGVLGIFRVASDSQDNVVTTSQFLTNLNIGDSTYYPAGNSDGLIAKYDHAGNVLWSVNLYPNAGDVAAVEAYAVNIDSQDNIIVSGTFEATVNFNPLGTPYNLTASDNYTGSDFIAKYSPAGILIWAKAINCSSLEYINNQSSVSTDAQNNVYYNTTFADTLYFGSVALAKNGTGENECVVKYSPAGVLQFARAIGGQGNVGYSNKIFCNRQNNDFYVSGYFTGTINFKLNTGTAQNLTYHGQQDLYVAQYDSGGNYMYAFNLGTASSNEATISCLAVDNKNNIDVVGAFGATVNFDPSGCSSDNVTAVGIADSFMAQFSNGSLANNVITAPTVSSFCTTGTPAAITGSLPTGGGTYTYQWQSSADSVTFVNISGAIAQNYTPPTLTATTYYRRVVSSTGGCGVTTPLASNIVAITIGAAPAVPMVAADTTCAGSTATLSVTSPQTGITYNWYTAATGGTSLFTGTSFTTPALTATTTYYAEAENIMGCSSATRAAAIVTVLPILDAPVVTVGSTFSSSVIFTWAAITGATGYQVSTDGGQTYTAVAGLSDTVSNLQAGQSVTIIVQAKGTLSCQLSAASASVTATAASTNTNASDIVFVPNAFTPNGDGRDDILHVRSENIKTFKFFIYDQWGELLFSTTSQQNGWDGTYKGAKEPVGVYIYFLQAVMNDGSNINKKGMITLLK